MEAAALEATRRSRAIAYPLILLLQGESFPVHPRSTAFFNSRHSHSIVLSNQKAGPALAEAVS